MEKHTKKGNNMRALYIKRRIAVIAAVILFAISGNGMIKMINKPTFNCRPGSTVLGHRTIWTVADQYCSGNITDAAKQIMKDNEIQGKDLTSLRPAMVIVIKGGN